MLLSASAMVSFVYCIHTHGYQYFYKQGYKVLYAKIKQNTLKLIFKNTSLENKYKIKIYKIKN